MNNAVQKEVGKWLIFGVDIGDGNLANYFDYETFGRELFLWDYNMGANGIVFRRS